MTAGLFGHGARSLATTVHMDIDPPSLSITLLLLSFSPETHRLIRFYKYIFS